jgi:hypothetical protein
MKILVCGNGPSLLRQLKGKSLNEFSKVVRVNDWHKIDDNQYCNRCEAWVMYPLHHIGEKGGIYDLIAWSKMTTEIWLAHSYLVPEFARIFGRVPDYVLPTNKFFKIMNDTATYAPTTGVLAIHMALNISDNVTVAGFDLYTEGSYYYDQSIPTPTGGAVHSHDGDRLWLKQQIKKGRVKKL